MPLLTSQQEFVIENTPQEIRDLVVEMAERLNGTWQSHDDDEVLQKRFWELFPKDAWMPTGDAPCTVISALVSGHVFFAIIANGCSETEMNRDGLSHHGLV